MKIVVTETFAAPIDSVFNVVSDIAQAAERISGIQKIEILSDVRSGLGLRWRETRIMFGKEATEDMEITRFDPPTSYRIEARSHGMHYVTEMTLRAVNPTITEVTNQFTGTPLTLGAKLMSPLALLAAGPARKALHNDLKQLKAFIEQSQPATANSHPN